MTAAFDRRSVGLPMRVLKAVVLVLACALVIVPFLAVISTSLADVNQVSAAGGYVLWPENPSLEAYRALLRGGVVTRAMLVSVGVTVVGTALSLLVVTLLAFTLSFPDSWGHRTMLMGVVLTMLFAPGMIPSYLMVRQLGLLDSLWALILPTLVSGFQVIIVRNFFMAIPSEIVDAARIDGAGPLRLYAMIMVPLSKAAIAVVALFNAVAYWNAFFNALLYINDTRLWPIQLVLRTFVVDNSAMGTDVADASGVSPPPSQSLQMAMVMIALVPILLVYPLIQRHFAKGIILGAVKG